MRFNLIFPLFLIMGCSSGKTPSAGENRMEFSTQKAALEVLNSDQVACQGECPPAVGAFYMYHKKNTADQAHEVRLCSASLIAKNRILTNKHCIQDVLKAGDVCSEKARIEIKFPKTAGHAFATYKCRRIVSASEDYFLTDATTQQLKRKVRVPDWAVIELTENVQGREPVKMSGAAVDQDNVPVTLFPVFFNKQTSPPSGVIRQVRCVRTYNKGGAQIFSNDSDSPLFRIESCSETLIQGNSGTGVFYNQSTELLGVMANSDGKNGAGGTMAHCVPDFSQSGSPCIFSNDQEYVTAMKNISFMNRLSHSLQGSLDKFYPWSSVQSFKFVDSLDLPTTPQVKFILKESWMENARYFEKKGSAQLARRYVRAFQNLVLPRLPQCYAGGLAAKMEIPLSDMGDWKKLHEYQWAERIATQDNGEDMSIIEDVSVPAVQVRLRPVAFLVTQKSEGIVAEALEKDLPSPVRSLRIHIPPCH